MTSCIILPCLRHVDRCGGFGGQPTSPSLRGLRAGRTARGEASMTRAHAISVPSILISNINSLLTSVIRFKRHGVRLSAPTPMPPPVWRSARSRLMPETQEV